MTLTVLTPEEEILATFEKCILEEFNPLIENINIERSETWLTEIKEISTVESNNPDLPSVYMTIEKVVKTTKDNNFTEDTFVLTLTITFKENSTRSAGYRYNYTLNKMITESTELPKIADRILIEEMTYNRNQRGDDREPSTAAFEINIIRET